MKRFFVFVLVVCLIVCSLAACDNTSKATDDNIGFDNYSEIVNLFRQMANNCKDYSQEKDVNGEYESMFHFENDKELEWYRDIFQSMLICGESDISLYGYSIGDIDQNGTDELLLMLKDYTLLAIFSISDGTPVLLDTFWNRKRAVINADGNIIISGSSGVDHSTRGIYKISPDGAFLELVFEIGTDGFNMDSNETQYYKLQNSEKEYISSSEYFVLLSREPFCNENISSRDNKYIVFRSLFE